MLLNCQAHSQSWSQHWEDFISLIMTTFYDQSKMKKTSSNNRSSNPFKKDKEDPKHITDIGSLMYKALRHKL